VKTTPVDAFWKATLQNHGNEQNGSPITLQHKKFDKINCYLDLFHRKGVFIRQGLDNQTALQFEPLERATLLQ
jgi:hypothetical protein